MWFKKGWKLFRLTVIDFIANRILKLSAALAYYTIFSLPGLIIIVIWVSDIFYGHNAVEGSIYSQIEGFVGKDAAAQIQETIRNATLSNESSFATVVGIVTLVI